MARADTTILAAFSVDHAARVTGLSKSRLTRWDQLGFFSPEYLDDEDKGNPYARAYSFTDLVGLRTLKILADTYRVSMSELRKAAIELEKRSSRPWAEIPLAVLKRKVVFDLDTRPRNVTDGQYAIKHILLGPIADEVRRLASQLKHRRSSQMGKVVRHKFIAHNASVISGTRIPVEAVASYIKAGYSSVAIIAEYPSLTRRDIEAVRRRLSRAA